MLKTRSQCTAALRATVLFLSALCWTSAGAEFKAEPLNVVPGKTGFTLLSPAQTGIHFTNQLADERSLTNRNLLSGSGVAAGDIDGDGWCDAYFCNIDGSNRLYRNLGNWKFEDVTDAAGVACPGQDDTGATFADIDGDTDLDLLVNALGAGTRVFENDGKGKFREITDASGVGSKAGSMSLALADVEGDGDLDLYVANFRPHTIKDQPRTNFRVRIVQNRAVVELVNGRPATAPDLTNRFVVTPSGNVLELAEPDGFFLNDGKGRFTSVPFTSATFLDEDGKQLIEPPRDWGLAVQFHDMNADGAPDIYVCNDLFTPDRIWINDGKGRFRALAALALRNTSTFSMGVDFADIDRDGDVDFFVTDMQSRDHRKRQVQVGEMTTTFWPIGIIDNRPQLPRNTLQVNRGDTTFAELAYYAGVESSDWSWGPIFLDVDLDGFEDLLIPNGQLRDFQNVDMAMRIESSRAAQEFSISELIALFREFPSLATPNFAFRNRGDLTFEEVGQSWGFATPIISQGVAYADLDNDGDADLLVNNLHAAAGVYRNDTAAPRIAIVLNGTAPNTRGIGAKIRVAPEINSGSAVPLPVQTQEVICGGRYLSGSDPMRVFAAGSTSNRFTIEIQWRSGKRSMIKTAVPNHRFQITEPAGDSAPPSTTSSPTRLFEDVSHLIKHVHVEEPFDDFERQPLLPYRLSQLGPGVTWHDANDDGWDDLFIATGRGGQLAYYRNNANGGFVSVTDGPLSRRAQRDLTTVLGWGSMLVMGASNFEDGSTNGGCVRIVDLAKGASGDSILGQQSSTGPLAFADVDADGDLDLFVGGRSRPGRWPEAADSLLMSNDGGRLMLAQRFEKLGLVSGAVFTDVAGDATPELVLACEWSPIRIFQRENGTFQEITSQLGLSALRGWWNGIAAGDFNGDGRMDLVASNWGLNTRYRLDGVHPRSVYFSDFDSDGSFDVFEAYYDPELDKEVPERRLNAIGGALPFLRDKYRTFAEFGNASTAEILGDKLSSALKVEVNTLASMLFLNRGGRFEAVPLPREAQFAPAFGVAVADLDGDGNEDVFLSQNLFALQPESSRSDAGRGLILKGDGTGALIPVPAQQSGIEVYGEQRGAALSDFDADGRVDLAVAQNGNATRLYRNRSAKPGLRVRLKGPVGNSTAVGAVIRLKTGDKLGPLREIHAGSGYWSCDSAVQILAAPSGPVEVSVRWPGGKETISAVPQDSREIQVESSGAVQRLR